MRLLVAVLVALVLVVGLRFWTMPRPAVTAPNLTAPMPFGGAYVPVQSPTARARTRTARPAPVRPAPDADDLDTIARHAFMFTGGEQAVHVVTPNGQSLLCEPGTHMAYGLLNCRPTGGSR